MLTLPPVMEPFRGKTMSDLCPFSLGKKDDENHCAHFVSHVMGYALGAATCKNMTAADKKLEGTGVTIRVDEIFNKCPNGGNWNQRHSWQEKCLIFVTISSNVFERGGEIRMKTHSRKHIGIFINGVVWHYANGQDRVVCDDERVFTAKFSSAYRTAGNTVEFYFGDFIKTAQPVPDGGVDFGHRNFA